MSVFNLLKKLIRIFFAVLKNCSKFLEFYIWKLLINLASSVNKPATNNPPLPAHLRFRRQLCRLKLSLKTLIENIHWNHCRVFNLVLHYVLNFLDSLIIIYHRCHIISQQRNRYMQGNWPLFLTIDLITLDFPF